MKQITTLDEDIRTKVVQLENTCEQMINKVKQLLHTTDIEDDREIIVEFIRLRKGSLAKQDEIFDNDYESLIEIGLEINEEYYPNAYIPIWKCKSEWFERLGYMTNDQPNELESKICKMIQEIIAEIKS